MTWYWGGVKTATWRLFDDKNLAVGDELLFINKETGENFGSAKITYCTTKTLGMLTDEDWIGHDRFASDEVMYQTFQHYYGDAVTPNTEVKIIHFTFTPTEEN